MEGREDMSSTPYYHHHHGLHLQSGFMPVTNTNNNISVQSNNTSTHFAASTGLSGELVKKKRGRPRKYGLDGSNVSLGLSPLSAKSPAVENTTPNPKKRGRPPGSGRKQQLSSLGEWMNSSAGLAFAPHVMHIAAGEDVASKVLSFSQQRSRAVCILSATGTVSAVSLRQPTSSANNVTYEGRFQILCLSGSYLVAENGGPRSRTGGISVSLCSSDGHVIGGAVGGMLTAAGPVQVVLCSFTYGGGGLKVAQPELISPKVEHKSDDITSSSSPPNRANAPPSGQNLSLSSSSGMMSGLRQNTRNPQMDIDLMRG
ncbi:AT-hook motif nuclear-localized protein 5-like [Impatiens glandulifera]|uniref:AT-hook motif nuclear-localized protein 5-like n=1 Tax=Impatiens glandulifera TaxID=253017 RepID=UPI001FB15B8B|nr:AT-hook motif nuclear-localized protein 5-like [Impatiens glandulifera]